MGVVESENPPVVPIVQRQGITDAMRNMLLRYDTVRLELGPKAAVHGKDFTIQMQQGDKGFIFHFFQAAFGLHGRFKLSPDDN